MAVLLALGSAFTFGIADFLGGMASRRAALWSVVVGSQFFGLLLLVAALPFLPSATVTVSDMAWGAAAGIAGATGLVQFFSAMSRGAMSTVAPVSAVLTATVPLVAGLGFGERPELLAWMGIALALPAIALISREHVDSPVRLSPMVLRASVLAGLGFGAFNVLVDRTGDAAGIQPLIGARVASVLVLGSIGLASGRMAMVRGRALALIASSGVLDMAANVLFLYSVREGLLALGSVLAAMYPASTLVLARTVLGERMQRIQIAGLGVAAAAVVLITLA